MTYFAIIMDVMSNMSAVGPFPTRAAADAHPVPAQFDRWTWTADEYAANVAEFGTMRTESPCAN